MFEAISKAVKRMKEGRNGLLTAPSSVMIYTQHVMPSAR